jgi:hypothetical protein
MESSLGCRPTIRDLNGERLVDVTQQKEYQSHKQGSGFSARALLFVKKNPQCTRRIFWYVQHTNKIDDIIMSPITRKLLDGTRTQHTLWMSRTLGQYLSFIYDYTYAYCLLFPCYISTYSGSVRTCIQW